jgi:hypothetical protein
MIPMIAITKMMSKQLPSLSGVLLLMLFISGLVLILQLIHNDLIVRVFPVIHIDNFCGIVEQDFTVFAQVS